MITGSDIVTGVTGTLAAARGKADWADRFDMSVEGVFRSLYAPLLALPFLAFSMEGLRRVAIMSGESGDLLDLDPAVFVIGKTIVTYLQWAVGLGLIVLVASRLEEKWRVTPALIASNWANFLLLAILAPLLAVRVAGIGGGPGTSATGLILLGVTIFSLWLDWGVMRRPLGLGILPALAVVFAFELVGLFVDDLGNRLLLMLFLPT